MEFQQYLETVRRERECTTRYIKALLRIRLFPRPVNGFQAAQPNRMLPPPMVRESWVGGTCQQRNG